MKNRIVITRCLPVLAAALLTACASTPQRPDWVDGMSADYPQQGFLLGRGQADSQAEAADRARADLAKIFAVQVNATSSDTQEYQALNESGQSSLAVSRSVTTHTDQLLRGVEISDYWQDPASQNWHALAVLSRLKAGQGLRQDIAALDARTRGLLQQAKSGEQFHRIALVSQALLAQQQRADLNRTLQAVEITGRGVMPQWNTGELAAQRSALMAQIRITPHGSGDNADAVRAMLGAALAKAGITVAPSALYTMDASLDYSTLPARDDWHWVRGTLQVTLHDAKGNALGVERWELKASATDAPTAKRRFLDVAAEKLEKDIEATLVGFALGEASD